jgi:hypothetical protein
MCKDLHGYRISEDALGKRAKAEAAGYRFINFEYNTPWSCSNF